MRQRSQKTEWGIHMLLGVYEPELGPDGSLALPQHYLSEAKDEHIFARVPQEPGPILLFAFRQEAFFLPEDEQEDEPESLGKEFETLVLPLRNGAVKLSQNAIDAAGEAPLVLVGVRCWAELWRRDDWEEEAQRLSHDLEEFNGPWFNGIP